MIENLDQNQIIFIVTVMAASAVVVGFMAGFFGIGGGLIMVPILFHIFDLNIFQKDHVDQDNFDRNYPNIYLEFLSKSLKYIRFCL